jgi:uncharacterized protein (DUF433 family)
MSTVMTLRVQDDAAEQIKRIARSERRSQSEVGARAIEEWVRMELFPYIEFRSFGAERQACLKGRLQVWQVVMVATDHNGDIAAVAEHLSLRPDQVRSALDYYAHYGEEIDELIQRNEEGKTRLQRLFPDMLAVSIPDSGA